MGKRSNFIYYISVGAGMAMATSSCTMISGLYRAGSLWSVPAGPVVAGVICILIAASVGELASMFPSAPGIRTYLKVAFGDRFSLMLVYLYLSFLALAGGMESYMFALVVKSVFPSVSPLLLVYLMLLGVLAINWMGMELPKSAQIVSTGLLILGTILLGILPFLQSRPLFAEWGPDPFVAGPFFMQLPALIGMAVFLFVGFEWVTPLGKGPDSYRRSIPFSMPVAIIINIVMNIIFCVGLTASMGKGEIMNSPLPQIPLAFKTLGSWGGPFALALSALASFSTFNAGILGGSRMVYGLAREGKLPAWCASIHMRSASPRGGILFLGAATFIASTLMLLFRIEILSALVASAMVCFTYGAIMAANLRLRKTRPAAQRPFRSPLPLTVQLATAIAAPLLGIACLFSQPELGAKPVLLAVGLVAASFAATRIFIKTPKRDSIPKKPVPAENGGVAALESAQA